MPTPPAEVLLATAHQRLRPVDTAALAGDSTVQRFYEEAVVFLTGGSGFLGQQLIEKMFRTFNIKKVYVLLREKKGKSLQQRLDQILNHPVYDGLRESCPWFAERIEAVEGDIVSDRLGMSDETWGKLADEVTVVIHSAATVNFNEPLKTAVEVNLKGTLEMLDFGKACKNLKAFVHVSTAYSQALSSRVLCSIPEQFSTTPMKPLALVNLAKLMDLEGMNEIQHKLLGTEYENTYVYTKAVAEEAVRTMAGDLPICVVRPTIVIPAYTEPSPGWVDRNNVFGPSGIILGLSLGLIHTLIAEQDIKIDVVPVDLVNNAILAAGWAAGSKGRRGEEEPRIYTVGSSARNHIKWSFITNVLDEDARVHVSPQAKWYAFAVQTTNRYIFFLLSWILHFIPGYVADAVLILMGKKPQATKIYRKIHSLVSVLCYFTCRSWTFQDDNTLQLFNSLSEKDKQIFNIDITAVDMRELVLLWHLGLRKFILKDSLEDREEPRRKQMYLKIVTYIIMPLYLYGLFKIVFFVVFTLFSIFF